MNAANQNLSGGGGVDGVIHQAAGPELDAACKKIGHCATGEAVITPGFRSNADYIIHTVGPVYSGKPEDAKLLASCYLNSLDLAKENDIKQIVFPAISCGVYGYPVEKAVPIAVESCRTWLSANPDYPIRIFFIGITAKVWGEYFNYMKKHPY